jgi:hypothetical protein
VCSRDRSLEAPRCALEPTKEFLGLEDQPTKQTMKKKRKMKTTTTKARQLKEN